MLAYPFEIQVRTYFQHIWPTTSESFGEQVKEGRGTPTQREYLAALSDKGRQIEETQPERQQVAGLSTESGMDFLVVGFDKKRRKTDLKDLFGGELNRAVQRVLYLEDLHRGDFSYEVVLIGTASDESDAPLTHMRYFVPHAIPLIPDEIDLGIARPER